MNKRKWQKKAVFLFALLITSFGCGSVNNLETEIQNPPPPSSSEKVLQPQISRISAEETDAAEPTIATSPDGKVFVAWVEHLAKKEANVIVQSFNKEGRPSSEKVRVNPQIGQATAWRGDPPSVAVAPDGAVYVVWTARVASADGHSTDIYISASRDAGRSFAPPVKVNDDTVPNSHGMHSLAVDKSGQVYVAWLDERNIKKEPPPPPPSPTPALANGEKPKHVHPKEPNREVFFSVSTDGGKTFSANKKLGDEVCPCCETSILAADDGKVYVSWRQVLPGDFRHIAIAASTDKGDNFTAPTIVSDDQWQIAACPVSGATLLSGAENSLKVLWFTSGKAGPPGLYMTESKDNGKTFAPRTLVSEVLPTGTASLLAKGDKYSVVWGADNAKVFLKNAENADQEMAAGELPAAAFVDGNVLTSFLKKEDGKRGVWLSVLRNQ
ncbi:MAG: glycoside hydrolase [Acidobacteriota bacterium]|nr:glycoside hydrolase [Acidobacteriota bacterium]